MSKILADLAKKPRRQCIRCDMLRLIAVHFRGNSLICHDCREIWRRKFEVRNADQAKRAQRRRDGYCA